MTLENQHQDSVIDGMETIVSNEEAIRKGTQKVKSLPYWQGEVEIDILSGGASNLNFKVRNQGRVFAVRIGEDNEITGVVRSNEAQALYAAGQAGVGPKLHYHGEGALIVDFLPGKALKPSDLRNETMLSRVAALLRQAHMEIPNHLKGKDFCLWPFHTCRWYLRDAGRDDGGLDPKRLQRVPEFIEKTDQLEALVGPVKIVFGHNDLMPQNIMATDDSIHLIDWEYSGFGPDLFDLGNLMMNAEPGEDLMKFFLNSYYTQEIDSHHWKRFYAMMLIAAIREGAWSMLMETIEGNEIEFDYGAYSEMCINRIDRLSSEFTQIT